MALDEKTKELVAVGVSVALKSAPTMENHVDAALKAGASLADIRDATKAAEKVRQELDELIKKIREELDNE